jgi:hypothetical protein
LTTKSWIPNFDTKTAFTNTLALEGSTPFTTFGGFSLGRFEFNPAFGKKSCGVEISGGHESVPGLTVKASNTDNKEELSLKYEHAHGTVSVSTAADFKNFSASVTTGNNDITVGAIVQGNTPVSAFDNLNLSVAYTGVNKLFVGVGLADKFKTISNKLAYEVDKTITVGTSQTFCTVSKSVTLSAGLVYKCNADTTLKAKFDLSKNVDLSVKHAVAKGLSVSGWSHVEKGDAKAASYGVKVLLG